MTVDVKLPELGENIDSADVIKVNVKAGDKVELDQVLLEIETDKATIEVPSEIEGTVAEVLIKKGEKAKVGDVIFRIEKSGAVENDGKTENTEETEKMTETETAVEEVKSETKKEEGEKGIVEFKIPELGENIETAQIVKVLVAEGGSVKTDDPVLEIETDKATIEVPIEFSGTVKKVNIKDGETVKIGDVAFLIETEINSSSAISKSEEPTESKGAEPSKEEKVEVSDEIVNKTSEQNIAVERPKIVAPATPTTRRFAREIGIDINQVKGSGPGGRISIDDVKLFAKKLNEQMREGKSVAVTNVPYFEELPDFSKWGAIRKETMSNVRRKTAQHLSYAWATVPHVTQFDKADVTKLEETRKRYAKQAEALGGKLTITAILLKVIAAGLRKYPDFNSSVDMKNGEIIYKDYCNVGIAVDTSYGLLVPVIKDADKKSILELSVELTEISKKAREKKLTLEEMQGGNFTISNLGGIGGTAFTPVVNTPEVAILGVSRGVYEPVFIDGEFEPRLMMPLSLSYDHRVIDGALAAKFLRWVCESLENPILLLM